MDNVNKMIDGVWDKISTFVQGFGQTNPDEARRGLKAKEEGVAAAPTGGQGIHIDPNLRTLFAIGNLADDPTRTGWSNVHGEGLVPDFDRRTVGAPSTAPGTAPGLAPAPTAGGMTSKPKAAPFVSSLNARVRDIGGGNEKTYRYASPEEMAKHPDKGCKIEPSIDLGKTKKGVQQLGLGPTATKELFPDKGGATTEGQPGAGGAKSGGDTMMDIIKQEMEKYKTPRQMMSPGGSPYDTSHSDAASRLGLIQAGIEHEKTQMQDKFHTGYLANQKENIEVIKSQQNAEKKAKDLMNFFTPYAISDPNDPTKKRMNIPFMLETYMAEPQMFSGTPLEGLAQSAKQHWEGFLKDSLKDPGNAKLSKKDPQGFRRNLYNKWKTNYAGNVGGGMDMSSPGDNYPAL